MNALWMFRIGYNRKAAAEFIVEYRMLCYKDVQGDGALQSTVLNEWESKYIYTHIYIYIYLYT